MLKKSFLTLAVMSASLLVTSPFISDTYAQSIATLRVNNSELNYELFNNYQVLKLLGDELNMPVGTLRQSFTVEKRIELFNRRIQGTANEASSSETLALLAIIKNKELLNGFQARMLSSAKQRQFIDEQITQMLHHGPMPLAKKFQGELNQANLERLNNHLIDLKNIEDNWEATMKILDIIHHQDPDFFENIVIPRMIQFKKNGSRGAKLVVPPHQFYNSQSASLKSDNQNILFSNTLQIDSGNGINNVEAFLRGPNLANIRSFKLTNLIPTRKDQFDISQLQKADSLRPEEVSISLPKISLDELDLFLKSDILQKTRELTIEANNIQGIDELLAVVAHNRDSLPYLRKLHLHFKHPATQKNSPKITNASKEAIRSLHLLEITTHSGPKF